MAAVVNGVHAEKKPEVLIYGVGSVGAIMALLMTKGGANVTGLARSNYKILKERGLYIRSRTAGEAILKIDRLFHTDDIEKATDRQYDFVLVCAKAYVDLQPLNGPFIKPVVGPKTAIVLVQNGMNIEHLQSFIELYPNNTIIMTAVFSNFCQEIPGLFHNYTPVVFDVGYVRGQNVPTDLSEAQLLKFTELFNTGGGKAQPSDEVQLTKWKKHCLNAPMNAILAILRITSADLWAVNPDFEDIIYDTMKEVQAVAKVLGNDIPDEHVDNMIKYNKNSTLNKSSTMSDVARHRPLELATFYEWPIEIAKQNSIPVPNMRMLYAFLKAIHERTLIETGRKPKPANYWGLVGDNGLEKKPWKDPFEVLAAGHKMITNRGIDWPNDYTQFV